MTMFAHVQDSFAAALLDPALPVPPALTAHSGGIPGKRFAVYRNNVVVSLIEALRARFPAIEKIVGEEFFAAMARAFVSEHPPRAKILSEYGDDLPGFIARFAPAAHLRYLPAVARLEAARTQAYHAADAEPLPHAALAQFDAKRLFALTFATHPSMRIVRSRHPIVTIWAMNSGELELGPIDEAECEDALIIRPHFDVQVRRLPAGGAVFLQSLTDGLPLGEAAQYAADSEPGFELVANLAGLIDSGALAGLLNETE
jgi:hypothetical protein